MTTPTPEQALNAVCDMIAEERDAWEKRAKALEAENARLLQLVLSPGTIPFNWQERAERAEAENAALRKDALRYRWLRSDNKTAGVGAWHKGTWYGWGDDEEMDATIDAALAGAKA